MVTVFYFAFMCLFALIGVHVIGGLDGVCMYRYMENETSGNIEYALY